jgi:hypothetical protein
VLGLCSAGAAGCCLTVGCGVEGGGTDFCMEGGGCGLLGAQSGGFWVDGGTGGFWSGLEGNCCLFGAFGGGGLESLGGGGGRDIGRFGDFLELMIWLDFLIDGGLIDLVSWWREVFDFFSRPGGGGIGESGRFLDTFLNSSDRGGDSANSASPSPSIAEKGSKAFVIENKIQDAWDNGSSIHAHWRQVYN